MFCLKKKCGNKFCLFIGLASCFYPSFRLSFWLNLHSCSSHHPTLSDCSRRRCLTLVRATVRTQSFVTEVTGCQVGSRAVSPTSCRANHLFVFPTARAAEREGGMESESESRRSSEVHPDPGRLFPQRGRPGKQPQVFR